eukprot:c10387_g1_i1 orf=491-1180(-)
MSEEKSIIAAPPPPAPNLGIVVPPKRKKGRPPKNRALVPEGENSTVPPPQPKPDGRGRKPKPKNSNVVWPAVDSAFVGQQVHGVLDGSFDAGYLLTVRVGNTQTVLRGAVFEPSLSVPISHSNDIAPSIKFISREDMTAPIQCLTEYASTALPSPVVAPPISSGGMESTPTPMKEDKRPPFEGTSAEPVPVPTEVKAEGCRDASSPLCSSDHVTEEKMDLQLEPQSQAL